MILVLVDRAADGAVLDYIGAGPLEDLVNEHGSAFVDRIAAQAAADPRFARALRYVRTRRGVPARLTDLIETGEPGEW